MKLIRAIRSPHLPKHGCALTIGNFDAVHLGHQQILKTLRKRADSLGLPAVVMTFDPHPEEFFLKDKSSPRITDRATRYFALRNQGVDVMLLLRFNQSLAQTTAEDFISEYLIDALKVKHLLIGDDFHFGRNRAGNITLLKKFSTQGNYQVEDTDTIFDQDERVSSTRVRRLLERGDLESARRLLGRRYNLVGRVIRGQQLGRQWGFPTLNLAINHKPALTGVFAVEVKGLNGKAVPGVANLGTRPTVDGMRTLLEVHLFDFDRSIYGDRVCVEFVQKIREERKFDSFDALKAQIKKDTKRAREFLL
ncbi:MAG: bifunctional riboflavin kinase/FAD synthetase [Gammaproteobacteria bacterium]|jgi:riboflavin kinase/FMN adenylyltransferase